MYPKDGAGGIGFATLRTYMPGRALGFGTHVVGSSPSAPGIRQLVVRPRADRPIVHPAAERGRGATGRSLLGVAFDRVIFEPVHDAMERRMMIGIKQLAEGTDRQRLVNHLHVVLWTVTFALFIAAIVLVMRRDEWQLPLAGFVAAGIVFQVLTFVQPPIVVGVALVAGVTTLLWPPRTGAHMLRPAVVGNA